MRNADVATVLWKEWKEIVIQRSAGGALRRAPLISIAIVGIFVPFRMGPAFFNPVPLLGITFFSALGVSVVCVDAFAGERERHTLETLLASRLSDRAILFGKIAASIGYGWFISIICIVAGTITVNLANWNGQLLIFHDAASWLILLLGPPLLDGVIATAGVLISLRATTVRHAQQTLTTGLMVVFLVIIFGGNALPTVWKAWIAGALLGWSPAGLVLAAAAVLLAIDLVLLLAGMARFQRARLVLD